VRTRWAAAVAARAATGTAAHAISAVQLLGGDALLPRFVVLGAAVLLPDWYRICANVAAGGRLRAEARDRVLVVGRADEVAALDLELHGLPERPAAVVASRSVTEAQVVPGAAWPLEVAAAEHRPTVLVLDRAAQDDDGIVALAALLHEQGVRVRTLSGFYEEWLGKLPVSELERASLFFDIGELHHARYGRAKRLVDLGLALAGTVALVAVVPVVWVANRLGNRGPLLYRQPRVGKGGQVFTLLKLRTMVPTADGAAQGEWTAEDDPRITRVGRLLRRSHLDELPQVLNVLRGDLSIVGPRPEQPHYVAELSDKLPFYRLRHLVRPGLTGWAQVKYGYSGSESDAVEKLQYEVWYLRHQSLRTDLRIVGRTARSVMGSEGGGR
jgi:lipopolysaccharide/colanic/teichoic acid biosynthesis glycosyltransferase